MFFVCFGQFSKAQNINQSNLPKQWQFYDLENDNIYGISALKTKQTIIKNKKPKQQIIVAVIDCGTEINHNYLKNYIWTNKKEIPNNNIDDDKNGYIDDIIGWNFVGNTKSSCDEDIRDYIFLKPKFENLKDSTVIKKHTDFERWKYVVQQKENFFDKKAIAEDKNYFKEFIYDFTQLLKYYKDKLNIEDVDFKTLKENPIAKEHDSTLHQNYLKRIKYLENRPDDSINYSLNKKIKELNERIEEIDNEILYANTLIEHSNPYYYFHKENIYPENLKQKYYGNNNINPREEHGTACAGLIVDYNYLTESNNIFIMPIRIFVNVHQEEQNDKDLYNAIKYSVDNGAKVINMSFSNSTCLNRKLIDKAFRYAQKKGVIIVQSAGNLSINIDNPIRFPSAELANGKRVDNVIRVGASSYSSNNLACNFSNYGQQQVNVFAPGEHLYYPTLNNEFIGNRSGTSFATPIVAGLVASIWSYYPKLNYKQIIYCIEKSAIPIEIEIAKPNSSEKIKFTQLSKTGGIINMFNVFRIAEDTSKGK